MDKLEELQVLFMDQQRIIEQLNDTLLLHDKKITRFNAQLTTIESKLQHALDAMESGVAAVSLTDQEKPPHY